MANKSKIYLQNKDANQLSLKENRNILQGLNALSSQLYCNYLNSTLKRHTQEEISGTLWTVDSLRAVKLYARQISRWWGAWVSKFLSPTTNCETQVYYLKSRGLWKGWVNGTRKGSFFRMFWTVFKRVSTCQVDVFCLLRSQLWNMEPAACNVLG